MTPAPSASVVFCSVTDAMSTDHDRIDALLEDVRVMVEDGELERADHFFADARTQLLEHIRIEEDVLFPALETRLGTTGPQSVMRRQHERIVGALDRAAGALARQDAAAFHACDRELYALLSAHNAKEERVLYPMLDRALTLAESQQAITQIRRSHGGGSSRPLDPSA
jgi:iron-sulfur cluster repair protein YtfE (RIC family)